MLRIHANEAHKKLLKIAIPKLEEQFDVIYFFAERMKVLNYPTVINLDEPEASDKSVSLKKDPEPSAPASTSQIDLPTNDIHKPSENSLLTAPVQSPIAPIAPPRYSTLISNNTLNQTH